MFIFVWYIFHTDNLYFFPRFGRRDERDKDKKRKRKGREREKMKRKKNIHILYNIRFHN